MATDFMKATTSYSKLKKKYRNFEAPTIRVYVDGVEIIEKMDAKLSGVTVDLTAEYQASGCSFDIIGEYKAKNTGFSLKGAAKLLQLGAIIKLELGYIETEQVFHGLVAEVEYMLDSGEMPYIHVECMDAKCLLMKRQRLELMNKKSITDAIGMMMEGQPFGDYIAGKKIEAVSDKIEMIPAAMEDDYQFTVRYAQYIGYEFFIMQGTVYFRKAPSAHSSVMTLSPDAGLFSVKQSLRGASLYKKTMVVGIDPANDKMVKAEADLKGKFGEGQGAARMLGQSQQIYFDHKVQSTDQAETRAKALMQAARGNFGRMECRCVGLPELVPGRSVSIEGVSPGVDLEYYILNVRHTFDERGFFTNLEMRIDTL